MEVRCSSQRYPNQEKFVKEKQHFPRRTAAALVGFGLRQLFPQIQLIGGGDTSIGFEYVFSAEEPLPKEALSMLDEWIRGRVRAALPIQIREMVPQSARALLESEGLLNLAGQIPDDAGLIEMVEIDGAYDLSSGPHLDNTSELKAFEILEIAPIDSEIYAIQGVTASNKQELKEWKKRLAAYRERNHIIVGKQMGLWRIEEESLTWLARGLHLRRAIPKLFVDQLPGIASELITPPPVGEEEGAPIAYTSGHLGQALHEMEAGYEPPIRTWEVIPHSSLGEGVEALFTPFEGTTLLWNSLVDRGSVTDELTALLQSIHKTYKILGFHVLPLLSGKQGLLEEALRRAELSFEREEGDAVLNFQARDELGREWTAATLQLYSHEEEELCSITLTVPVERNLALLLERSGGALPRSLIPEVLRFVPLDAQHGPRAEQEKQIWSRLGYPVGVDNRRISPSERYREAQEHRIPLIAIIGDAEVKSGTFSLRDAAGEIETLGREKLLERVNEELNIEN